MSNARTVAARVISDIERNGSYSNIALDAELAKAELSRVDSALASRIIYGVLSRKLTIDRILTEASGKGLNKTHPFVLSVLRTAVYQILFTDKIPPSAAVNESVKIINKSRQRFAAGFVNAVLRKISLEKADILKRIEESDDLSFKYSCTNELAEELSSDYSLETAEQFLESTLHTPKLYCRVNRFSNTQSAELKTMLEKKGIELEMCDTDGAFSVENVGNIEKLPEFASGCFFVQDLASQKAVGALDIAEGMCVLDVCAAPGGKSFTAAQFVGSTGHITSCDIYEKRVGLILSGAKRLKIDNLTATVNDAERFNPSLGLFDRVICDVPCSGFGVIRRKPEIKYKRPEEFEALPSLQLKILETSVGYLKNDGMIMYSTCTVRRKENDGVVQEFLKRNQGFSKLCERTLMPHTDGTDGFYFCILKRN